MADPLDKLEELIAYHERWHDPEPRIPIGVLREALALARAARESKELWEPTVTATEIAKDALMEALDHFEASVAEGLKTR